MGGDVKAGEEEEADGGGSRGGCLVRMAGNQKRGGEYDEFGGKRTRGYNDGRFEMRVLVPSRMAGSVIGEGGQNIQKIRSEFSAQVRIPDCPGPERVMSVVAADPQMVVKVLEATIPYMYELNSDTAENSGGAEREMRLLIHQSIVGGIIGKSGQRIKEIRENSGAAVKVYSPVRPVVHH